ncbi:MAG: hypothetical protein GXX94_07565 [Chloroflexi bacterium]|nr:hypothetical protein [Chloroflexota bacterium]
MIDLQNLGALIDQVLVALSVITGLFALNSRRLLIVPLALQYVLAASLISSSIGAPLYAIRLTLGLATSAIIYITASRMASLPGHSAQLRTATQGADARVPQMGPVYRLVGLALAALLAYGLWSGGAIPQVTPAVSLTALWLGAIGACMIIMGTDPLRAGIGLLVCASGFLTLYLSVESSLLVVALAGLVDIIIALAVAYISEIWLEAAAPESTVL